MRFLAVLILCLCLGSPGAAQRVLDPEVAEKLADIVLTHPRPSPWYRSATEAEKAAARLRIMNWIRDHPRGAGHLLTGFLLDERIGDPRFRQEFNQLLEEARAFYLDPERAVNVLEAAAEKSRRLTEDYGITPEELTHHTRDIFHGAGTGMDILKLPEEGILSPSQHETAFTEGSSLPKLNPRAFKRIIAGAQRSLAKLARLQGSSGPGRYVSKAYKALNSFKAVIENRPSLVKGIRPEEVKELNSAKNELWRWIAAATIESRYKAFIKTRREALHSEGFLKALHSAPVEKNLRKKYEVTVSSLSARLKLLSENQREVLEALERPDYYENLPGLRILAAGNEREARILSRCIKNAVSMPSLLNEAHQANKPACRLERLWRRIITNLAPNSAWARKYRRMESDEDVLRTSFASIANETSGR